MKRNTKITFSAMMAALATAFMLFSYFPFLTYAIPAIAGLFIMAIVIEIDLKWAVCAYTASAILVFILAEKESMLLYVAFFGYYPVFKALVEKIRKPLLEWPIKLVIFNGAVLLVYFVLAEFLQIPMDDMGQIAKYGVAILLAAANVVFVLYDIAVSRMAMMYMAVFKPKIKKIFK